MIIHCPECERTTEVIHADHDYRTRDLRIHCDGCDVELVFDVEAIPEPTDVRTAAQKRDEDARAAKRRARSAQR